MAAVLSSALGLYLHIPFCGSICNYCNFNRGLLDEALKIRYLKALEDEIQRAGDGARVDTIYFGGGTPSLLEPQEVSCLLESCREAFNVTDMAEVSFEVNPETATATNLNGWRSAGVTRLSFGVQSFRDVELQRLGRRHDAASARDAFETARVVGFENINLDLMLWLPEQTLADCRASIEALVELRPDHASLYMLELYPNAPLREEMARADWSLAPDDDAATMYLEALDLTDAAGYKQYEISNVALPGCRCRHNLKYWEDGEWLGFGCGAHSTRGKYRWKNLSDTARYVEAISKGDRVVVDLCVRSEAERLGDALFTGLRLVEGVDLARVEARYGVDVMARYGLSLQNFEEAKVLMHADGRLRLTRPGMLLANEVMSTFV